MNTLARHVNEEPILLPETLELPGGLRSIVNRMLDKNSKRRLGSAEEVLELLESWNTQEVLAPLSASSLSEEIEVVEVVQPPPWLFGAAAAVSVLIMLLAFAVAFVGDGSKSNLSNQEPAPSLRVESPAQDTLAAAEPTGEDEVETEELVVQESLEEREPTTPQDEVATHEAGKIEKAEKKRPEPEDRKVKKAKKEPAPNKLDFLRTLDSPQ